MQNDLIRRYKVNQRIMKYYNYSRRKKFHLGLLPIFGLLVVTLGITYDLYKIGEGNISIASNAAWGVL
jgi:hypothetical protein